MKDFEAAGFSPEVYEALEKAFERMGLLIEDFKEALIELLGPVPNTFAELFEQLKGVYYTPTAPIPKTPYSFRTKTRTIFKRLKIYHIRSNCRKER